MASIFGNVYIIAAIISAVPATIGSVAAWRNAKAGRRENTNDHAKVVDHLRNLDSRIETLDSKMTITSARMDLRFDSIEDKVERHLGWHRDQAVANLDLKEALKKEYKGDYPIYPTATVRPDDDNS